MTQIIGKLLDSANAVVTGKLQVTLSGNLIDTNTSPNNIQIPKPSIFDVTNGVINFSLHESETSKVTYLFEFFLLDTNSNLITPAILSFYAIIPNIATVQFANLVPTGMVNDALDTGSLRIAKIIANDPALSANIGGPFPKGDFNINTSYKYRDLVSYMNRTYISKSVNNITGILPTNTTYWMPIPLEPNGTLILGDATPYGPAWSGSGKSASQAEVYNQVEQKANSNSPSFTGNIVINNQTDSTAYTNGALIVTGGVSVHKNLTCTGEVNIYESSSSIIKTAYVVNLSTYVPQWGVNATRPFLKKGYSNTYGDYLYLSSTGNSSNTQQGSIILGSSGLISIGKGVDTGDSLSTNYVDINQNSVTLRQSTTSTSSSTGTLIIPGSGGIGVGGNIYADGKIYTNNIDVCNFGRFIVGGTTSNYYPVLFRSSINTLHDNLCGRQRLHIFRSSLHNTFTNAGTFDLSFSFQPTNYGNNISVIDNISYKTGNGINNDPVADIVDCTSQSGVSEVCVWLKGGLMYFWNCPEAGTSWYVFDNNPSGTNLTNSSGTTCSVRSTQSSLITNNKNTGEKAPIASPTFTGTPAAPTPSVSTSNTTIATTSFVYQAINNDTSWNDVTNFANNFSLCSDPNFNFLKYKKTSNNIVFISGAVQKSTAITGSSLIFTLPAGYRPIRNLNVITYCVVNSTNNTYPAPINIFTTGDVYCFFPYVNYNASETGVGISRLNLDFSFTTS